MAIPNCNKSPLSRSTRYFVFSCVNPLSQQYDHLIDTCNRINASLGYKTVREGWKVRLIGFIILRGCRTNARDLRRLFPNILLTQMDRDSFDGYDWMDRFNHGRRPFFMDGEVFTNGRAHPLSELRRTLFL